MTLGRKNHRPIRFRLRAILLGLILLLLYPSGSSARQKGESVHEVSLESGRMLTRELGGGAAHSYRIRLRAGEFIRVRVLQEGIDLVLALFDGGGAKLVETDRSSRNRVPEELLWTSRQDIDLLLKVRAPDAEAPKLADFQASFDQIKERNMIKFWKEFWRKREERKKEPVHPLLQAAEERGIPVISVNNPWALSNALAIQLYEQGQITEAEDAFRQTLASGDHASASEAAFNLGVLLEGRKDIAGAKVSYSWAIEHGDVEMASAAALNYAILLMAEGAVDEARIFLEQAMNAGHAEAAPKAAVNLGSLLAQQGNVSGAMAAYQLAIDSGHPDEAPLALIKLGALLFMQSDLAGAEKALQRAIASGHPEFAPMAWSVAQSISAGLKQ